MDLLGRMRQAYRSLFSPQISRDPRIEADDEYIVRNMMDGRFSLLEFPSDEQVAAELQYARDHPFPLCLGKKD